MASTKTPSRRIAVKKPVPPKAAGKDGGPRMTLATTMRELEKAGSAQTRKTYARHGGYEPMFGVSFATLKVLFNRIGVDHELATALWDTGNFDARNLAVKVADPSRMTSNDLDRWVREGKARWLITYVAVLTGESSHAAAKTAQWLAAPEGPERAAAWMLLGHMASRDETTPDAWFLDHLTRIERTIHTAPNSEREAMNGALIAIGCRSAALRKSAIAAAKRIGKVEVDHGDTACKTPDAAAYIEKTWAHSTSKGFETPAAHERSRESPRCRC